LGIIGILRANVNEVLEINVLVLLCCLVFGGEKPTSTPAATQMATFVAKKENNSFAVLRSSKCLSAQLRLFKQRSC
jgi:hypothetical protein